MSTVFHQVPSINTEEPQRSPDYTETHLGIMLSSEDFKSSEKYISYFNANSFNLTH